MVALGSTVLRAVLATTTIAPVGGSLEPPPHIGERPRVTAEDVAELVHAARRGDRAAFAQLYHRFSRAVHAVVLARAPYRDAGDLVQDVFVIALERLGQLSDPAAFPGWILTVARTRAIDHTRKRQPVELADEPVAEPVPTAEAKRVLDVIRALPDAYRETLIMRLVEGMSGPEIAERTGLSPGSVRVNLHRGMKLLRERLGVGEHAATGDAAREVDRG
jgi:RNA polymerase sigma-70 factor (ECF subfamily)